MMPLPEFWEVTGAGVASFLILVGAGCYRYLSQLEPCKHEWEFVGPLYYEDSKYGERYRCIHCCKKKEV